MNWRVVLFSACLTVFSALSVAESNVLSQLTIEPKVFDRAAINQTTISFLSSRSGQATVRLLGPDWHQVRELHLEGIEAGEQASIVWDGLDDQGDPVPAEAYFPLVELSDAQGRLSTLDAALTTTIKPVILENLRYDQAEGAVVYTLAAPARVTLHAGVSDGGPLLRTLLAEVPRLAGEHREPWDGMDEAGAVNIATQKKFRLFAEGIGMWLPTVVVRDADTEPYFSYRRRTESRFVKRSPSLKQYGGTPSALPRPRDITPEPSFALSVPGSQQGAGEQDDLPVVSGRVRVKVALDDRVRIPVLERRFEIVLFVDLSFVTEVEEGRTPATVIWDSTQVPDGERLLSVNVATLPGQMSSASLRVQVRNSP